MLRLLLFAFCLALFVGCDSAEDVSDSALLDVTVETPSGAPVEGLGLTMEYALGSGTEGEDGGDRIAPAAEITYFNVYTQADASYIVEWGTNEEEGVERFVVEAGSSENNLEDVLEVAPQGAFQPYVAEVEGDFALFRLRIEFADESVEFSEVVEPIVVSEEDPTVPVEVRLYTGYPNPFATATTIGFELSRATDVTLEVLDLEGRPVRALVRDERPAGQQGVAWEASPDLVGGFYRVRLTTAEDTASVLAVYTGPGVEGQDERLRVRTALGTTNADGHFTTEDRALFPQLYEGIEVEYRDENNAIYGVILPSREVTLVLRDGTGREQRYERTLSGAANRFDLTWDPE